MKQLTRHNNTKAEDSMNPTDIPAERRTSDSMANETATGAQPRPSVLFVCVHNAGRSQMAAGYLRQLSAGAIEVRSAGSEPADKINPVAVQAMAEEGIDIAAEQPKLLTNDTVKASDVVITMGCGDTCPYYPGKVTRTGPSTTRPDKVSMLFDPSAIRSASGWRDWSENCRNECVLTATGAVILVAFPDGATFSFDRPSVVAT